MALSDSAVFTLRFLYIASSRNLEGDPLFPDGFLDENVDCRRHAHADGVTKFLKVFFQIRVDANTNRCLCHDTPLFLADVLTDHFSLFLDQSFQFGNLLILLIHRIFQAFNLLSHGRLRRRDAAATLTNLEAQAGVKHIFPVAEIRTHTKHGIFIGTIEGTQSDTVGIAVIAVTNGEIPLVIRVEVQWMKRCQSSRTGTDLVDAVIEVRNTTIHMVNGFRVGRYLVVQSRQVFASRVGLFDEVAVFCNSRFVVDGPSIDSVLGAFLNRGVGYILDGRVFPQRNGLAVVTVIVDGVLGRSLQLVFLP